MIKKIAGTAGTRLIIAVITFIVVIINARTLGSEGVGEIALIVLGITIILLISNFVGGGALVYLIPRYKAFQIILPSYIWAVVSAALGAYVLNITGLIPAKYAFHIFMLSLMQALGAVNMNFLLGKEKIKRYNIVQLIQFAVLIVSLIVFYYLLDEKSVLFYVYSLYLAFGSALALSFLFIRNFIKISGLKELPHVLKQILKYGFYVQFANFLQLMNYRLSYYIIENYLGKSSLGIFDVGNKLSEGLWLVGKSVSMVQYSKISNTESKDYAVELTLRFLKFVFVSTFLMLVVLLILPQTFFTFVFGKDFFDVNTIIQALSPGILAMSLSMIFSHYFSGVGKHYHNTVSSAIGLTFTVVFGFTLIPSMGIIGAGITASLSYSASMLYQFAVFVYLTKTGISKFLISKDDIVFMKKEVKSLLSLKTR